MKALRILIALLVLFPAIAQGVTTLDMNELWRAGGEDGEVIFGRISDVVRHPNGEIMVLDNQLCQVEVFSPDGDYLRTLSR